MNVIGIDWDQLAWITNYLSAAYYSNEVGKYTAEHIIVDKLIGTLGQKHSMIEAVGHSLGAHLVGHLGRKTYELTGEKLARVTGEFCFIKVRSYLNELAKSCSINAYVIYVIRFTVYQSVTER